MAMKLYSEDDIQDIADAIRAKNGSSDTYTVSQMANAIENIPSGMSSDVKDALLAIFEKVAFIDNTGQSLYDDLFEALYPVSSISAVYTQSGTVYDTDTLDSLKSDLVVTATYEDGTTETVTNYTLSGTLTAGTSTITVTYGGQTDTFNVTVTLGREAIFGAFTNGYAVVTKNGVAYRNSTSARATTSIPCANNNYVLTVTDLTKYQINAVDITSLTQTQVTYSDSVDGYAYPKGSKTVGWNATDSVSTSYIWIVLKKVDNTAFTDAELANGAEAVFTFTENN